MNTSTKILAGFFLVVFLVPAMIFMSFKSKIRNDDFRMISRDSFEYNNWETGKTEELKMIRIVAPAEARFKVNLSQADSASYRYYKGQSDSISLHREGDVLVIRYISTAGTGKDSNGDVYLNLALPDLEQMEAENTEINLLSFDSTGTKNLSLDLKGTSRLNMGAPDDEEYQPRRGRKPILMNKLSARVENGSLFIGKEVNIKEMNVDAVGKSILNISTQAVVSRLQGTLSDSSSVNAGWHYLKQLNQPAVQ
ncbi:MAG TPA: hypothetical protein PLV32_10270 [Chitinophagaceae bacterium]|nr:hypothetical protein [Chitinophagaceae bacterium]